MRNMRLLFVVACFSLFSCTEQKPGLLLVNESNIDRVDEPVTLAKNALVGLIGPFSAG
jgi:hypothetical protein